MDIKPCNILISEGYSVISAPGYAVNMRTEAAPKMKVEKWHDELDQATQSILRAERKLKLEQPGTHG